MVGMLVGVHHGIDTGESTSDELKAQLRRSVDQDGGAGSLEYSTRSGSFVPRVGGATNRAVTADLGHAERRARAKEREPHFLNCFDLEEVGSPGHVKGNS